MTAQSNNANLAASQAVGASANYAADAKTHQQMSTAMPFRCVARFIAHCFLTSEHTVPSLFFSNREGGYRQKYRQC
jgi:hypothetical protein